MNKNISSVFLLAFCLILSQSCCVLYTESISDPSTGKAKYVDRQECWEPLLYLMKASIHGSKSWIDPLGFQAGATFPVAYKKPLNLRTGALLSLQGANWEEFDLKGRTSLLYAYVPLLVRYQHSSGFYGEAGLQPGLLLSAKDKYEGTTENYMDHMNKFDLSVPLAIGYRFKNSLGVSLKVAPGINDITKDEDEKDRNFVMGVGLTYTLNLKKK